jgi:hypothetical protein
MNRTTADFGATSKGAFTQLLPNILQSFRKAGFYQTASEAFSSTKGEYVSYL